MAKKNLLGQKFGRLFVLEENGRDNHKNVIWKCQCDCGTIKDVRGTHLTQGKVLSCGCLQKERTSEASRKNIEGQKFGLLLALKPTESIKNDSVVWECQCECGALSYHSVRDLNSGHVSSCGCLTRSKGELKIERLLKGAGLHFETEKSFDTCRFSDTNRKARFDFFVEDEYLIEYDGPQHFESGSGDFDSPEQVLKIQEHDTIKNQWCIDNNIPLIRIPYVQLNQLTIKDLLLETTSFLMQKTTPS